MSVGPADAGMTVCRTGPAGPPLFGFEPRQLARYTTACRASALVLEREGQPAAAAALREQADVADVGSCPMVNLHPGCNAPERRSREHRIVIA